MDVEYRRAAIDLVVRSVVLHRLENDRIVEDFVLTDRDCMDEQLNLVPAASELLRRSLFRL